MRFRDFNFLIFCEKIEGGEGAYLFKTENHFGQK